MDDNSFDWGDADEISLSYDHRIIDGAEGARFCVYLGKCLGKDFAFKLAV